MAPKKKVVKKAAKKVAKKKVTKKVAPKVEENPPAPVESDVLFHVLLEVGAVEYAGKGETLVEAIATMDKPVKYISRGVLVMRHNEKKVVAVMHPLKIRQVLNNTLIRTIWCKLYANALA